MSYALMSGLSYRAKRILAMSMDEPPPRPRNQSGPNSLTCVRFLSTSPRDGSSPKSLTTATSAPSRNLMTLCGIPRSGQIPVAHYAGPFDAQCRQKR